MGEASPRRRWVQRTTAAVGVVALVVATLGMVGGVGAPAAAGHVDPLPPLEPGACAEGTGPFTDVDAQHPFCGEITWAVEAHLTTGYSDGTFRPGAPVSRQAAAAFLVRGVPTIDVTACPGPDGPFPDVPADHVFCPEITAAGDAGLATGYVDGTFRPAAPVSRQAMAAWLYRLDDTRPAGGPCTGGLASPFPDVPSTSPFCTEIATLFAEGVVNGYADGTYRPATTVSRQAMIAFLVRILTAEPPAPVEPTVLISEVDYDQLGLDTAEFLELHNPGDGPFALAGSSVQLVNGGSGVAQTYLSIPLPDVELPAGGRFVICANAATVSPCDLDAAPNENLLQNGPSDGVVVRGTSTVLDAVAYEGLLPGVGESGGTTLADPNDVPASLSRCPDGVDTDDNTADFALRVPTPGVPNDCAGPTAGCAAPTVPIGEVQGTGPVSPLDDAFIRVAGVVVADLQAPGEVGGVFIQSVEPDGEPATSEGLFVAGTQTELAVGDVVHVSGVVTEVDTATWLSSTSSSAAVCATATVQPTDVDLPRTALDDLERYEGMLVRFPETLAVTDTDELGTLGRLTLAADGRLRTPTNGDGATAEGNALATLLVDDGRTGAPDPVPFLVPPTLRLGSTVTGTTGALHARAAGHVLFPTEPLALADANPRPSGRPDVGGTFTVASFNVFNWFTTLDDGVNGARGADSAAELERQRAKLVAALVGLDADVVGLVEVEAGGTALAALVDALNAVEGPGTWAAVSPPAEGLGSDRVENALIYRSATATPTGSARTDTTAVWERRPLAQHFERTADGQGVTVVVNHLKAKSGCPTAGDPDADQGDGQGCWNLRRVQQATTLLGFVDELEIAYGEDVLVMGDLNAYGDEDPVTTLEAGGLLDQIAARVAAGDRYTYVFDGAAGYLDHALVTPALADEVTGVGIWHINADEPRILDYNTELNPPTLFAPDAYRSSDHDPVVVGLALDGPPS